MWSTSVLKAGRLPPEAVLSCRLPKPLTLVGDSNCRLERELLLLASKKSDNIFLEALTTRHQHMGASTYWGLIRNATRRPGEASARRKMQEEALSHIVAGTSSVVGDQFFRAAVRHLAEALKVRFAFISELVDVDSGRLRLVAFWTGTTHGEEFEYDTRGTPCEQVVGKQLANYPAQVQTLFPDDRWLKEWGVESYLAIPLFDSAGNALGHLGVMHDGGMDDELPAESILRIFGSRACAELERRRAEEALRQAEARNSTLMDAIPDMLFRMNSNGTYLDFVPAAGQEPYVPAAEFLGRTAHDVLPPDVADTVMQHIRGALESGDMQRFEYELTMDEEKRSYEARIVVRGADEVLAVVRDVTALRREEQTEARRRARDELEGKVERQMLHKNPYGLTFRELTVLHLVAAGETDREIADGLGISPFTVSKHVANILSKLDASSRTEAGVRAFREGLLT